MIKLRDSQIAQILPEYLSARPDVRALSYAISRAMQRLIDYCGNISVYAMIDTATDDVLDMLAVELNTQYYDDSLDIEAKRRLIKGTMVWYMHAGTPQAVEELIAAVFGEGSVQEWFEYGDQPYYFKIVTNAQMTPETDALFSMMLERVKNARSHIRAIDIHRSIEQALCAGGCAAPIYHPEPILDGYDLRRTIDNEVYSGGAGKQVTHPEPILDGFSIKGDRIQADAHSGGAVAITGGHAVISEAETETAMRQAITASNGR